MATSVAHRSVEQLNRISNLPPSFDGDPMLYALALTSVMSIACLGLTVTGWMARDTWRDRFACPRKRCFSASV